MRFYAIVVNYGNAIAESITHTALYTAIILLIIFYYVLVFIDLIDGKKSKYMNEI